MSPNIQWFEFILKTMHNRRHLKSSQKSKLNWWGSFTSKKHIITGGVSILTNGEVNHIDRQFIVDMSDSCQILNFLMGLASNFNVFYVIHIELNDIKIWYNLVNIIHIDTGTSDSHQYDSYWHKSYYLLLLL